MTRSPNSITSRDELQGHLAAHGQGHLLRFWDELDDRGQARLASQIGGVDFKLLGELFRQSGPAKDWAAISRRAVPPAAIRIADRQQQGADARRCGADAVRAGKVGILLVAGGQGSRLGFEHPKGLYPIGPVSGASLLQIHFEKALALARRHQAPVSIYLMTSPATHAEQAAFLAEHDRFGLPEDDVVLFCQGTMPAVDAATGRLLLAAKDSLFLSPDGHGGTVAALARGGALEHMRRRGVEHLFYLQVDNPLAPIGDVELIGSHLLTRSELTSMAVAKQTPRDKVGNFVSIDGRAQVIEYSDFPVDVADRRDAAGNLLFWAGSIAVHVLSVSFLERVLSRSDALPFHIARKKVPYVDEAGRLVQPRQANALKFERFIFDLLPLAENALVVEYPEREVFAPLKNAPGEERDTPEYVQQMMIELHSGWLRAAGTRVAEGAAVEIGPLWALDAEGVAARADRPAAVARPTYFAGG